MKQKKLILLNLVVMVMLLTGLVLADCKPSPTSTLTENSKVTPTKISAANAILDAAAAYFSKGMKLITAQKLYENLNDGNETNNPIILDIRNPKDYALGHIPGAVNISVKDLFTKETLSKLPPDKQIVVYCYTGQTSAQVVAALNMLGYDAYSLKFGMPSWALVKGVLHAPWSTDMSMGYPVSRTSCRRMEAK